MYRSIAARPNDFKPASNNYTSSDGDIFRLYGDADGNRRVDAADFAAFRMAYGVASFAIDTGADGIVDSADFSEFRKRFGLSF